jgi:hypothetical protein
MVCADSHVCVECGAVLRDLVYDRHLPVDVQKLADNPTTKIEAIRLLRERTGLGLKEAKEAIEKYIVTSAPHPGTGKRWWEFWK